MKLEEFKIEISRINNNCVITDIEHEEFPTSFYQMNDDHKKRIIDTTVSFVTGKLRKIDFINKVWSDGDYDEPSTDCYVAIKKHNGLLSNIINNTDMLIGYIHDVSFNVYRIQIDDNLF